MVRLLIILFVLLVGSTSAMELSISGNATGIGSHNMSTDAPGANVTGNESVWLITWEDVDENRQDH